MSDTSTAGHWSVARWLMAVRCDDQHWGNRRSRTVEFCWSPLETANRRDIKRLNGAVSIAQPANRHSTPFPYRAAFKPAGDMSLRNCSPHPGCTRKLPELRRSRNWHTDSCHSSPCRCVCRRRCRWRSRKMPLLFASGPQLQQLCWWTRGR